MKGKLQMGVKVVFVGKDGRKRYLSVRSLLPS